MNLDLTGVEPWTPEEEAAERAYIAEYVNDPRLLRWIATLDAVRGARKGRTRRIDKRVPA